jgi:uncharacterized protein YdeI (YjbR/CyaY-like superfamily)
MKTLRVQSVDQWRKWLDKHHDSESEVWLIFYKLHTGVGSIAYLDALDEALCFGWVDSLAHVCGFLPGRCLETRMEWGKEGRWARFHRGTEVEE